MFYSVSKLFGIMVVTTVAWSKCKNEQNHDMNKGSSLQDVTRKPIYDTVVLST